MVIVQPKPLVRKLNAYCTQALEQAVQFSVARGHAEVLVEHFLLALLGDDTADGAKILRAFESDPARLQSSLQRALSELPPRSAGKPVFSPLLFELIQDAWVLASVEHGHTTLRSGVLLRCLAARPARYLSSDHPDLDRIRPEELGLRLQELVAASREEVLTVPDPSGSPAPNVSTLGDSGKKFLSRFASDLTASARAGRIDPVFGRERELRQVIDILARRRKNNPIIVGEAGVGKTAVVEGLALRIARGEVPALLKDVEVFALDLGALSAGAGVKGEFEARLKGVIDEVRTATKPLILFIDEAHTIIGAGGPAGGTDAANLLKPALARGELRTIAATTWAEYKKYFEEDAALARRFQAVKVDEPSVDDAIVMLRGLKDRYEQAHQVTVRDDAIETAVKLSARYIAGRLLPDKAVDLLDTAAARLRIGQTARPGRLEDLERKLEAQQRSLEALERDHQGGLELDPHKLETLRAELASTGQARDALSARWQAQQQAVETLLHLRRELGASPEGRARIVEALEALRILQGKDALVRVEVDPEVVAQIVGDWTGVPVGTMVRDEARVMLELERRLGERIRGQTQALDTVSRVLREARAGIKDPGKPQVFLLVGPSGVGKTELGLAVADLLYGGERFVVSINMSEYQDREMGVSGLVGAKPGYVGYGKGGTLTEAVRQRPYSVVLLDEIEKSCQEVRNLFYQVFDKGTLTDGTGRAIDFKNTVIFLTTNLGAEVIQNLVSNAEDTSSEMVLRTVRPLLSRALQPAWLARTTVVPFSPLRPEALREIAELKLRQLGKRLQESHGMQFHWEATVLEHIVTRCKDAETGARNIDFVLQEGLIPKVSSALLEQLVAGQTARALRVTMASTGFALEFDPVPVSGGEAPAPSSEKRPAPRKRGKR